MQHQINSPSLLEEQNFAQSHGTLNRNHHPGMGQDNSTIQAKMEFMTEVHAWLDQQMAVVSTLSQENQDARCNGIMETIKTLDQAYKQGQDFDISKLPMAPKAAEQPSLDGISPELRGAITDFHMSLYMKNQNSTLIASANGGGGTQDASTADKIQTASASADGIPAELHALATSIISLKLKLPGENGRFSLSTYGDFNSLKIILQNCKQTGIRSPDQVAYIIATAWHESRLGTWMTESGWLSEKSAEKYAEKNYGPNGTAPQTAKRFGNTQQGDGARYMGRGYVQLTWKNNYARMSKILKDSGYSYTQDGVIYGNGQNGSKPIDLVANYNHVNRNKDLAARILVLGMDGGHFVGDNKGLDSYIPENKPAGSAQFQNARKIVNGSDKKALIAENATTITSVLRKGDAWTKIFTPK